MLRRRATQEGARNVLERFEQLPQARFDTIDDAFAYIRNHQGPCGDGKTGDSRYRTQQGCGQNAEQLLAVLNTFGNREALFEDVVRAPTMDAAFEAMMAMRDWGAPPATGYLVKNMLLPFGCADGHRQRPLLPWSSTWGEHALSGPNTNKFFNLFFDLAYEVTERCEQFEQELLRLTRKVNWILPGLVTVDWHKKQRAKAIRKLNPMILQQTLCMVYHMLQWCTSGAAGHLPRNPRKVREEGCRKRRNPPLQAPSFQHVLCSKRVSTAKIR